MTTEPSTAPRPPAGSNDSASASPSAGQHAARRRDRRVYTRSHPVLFALLAATRRRSVARLGSTVLVHGTQPYRDALTRVPLNRTAVGTTGGAVRELACSETLFDQEGAGHRHARRAVAEDLGAAAVELLRPVWLDVLARHTAPLGAGHTIDLVPLARELAGATVCELLNANADPERVAEAAASAAAAAVRSHLPGPRLPGTVRRAAEAAARLEALLAPAAASSGRKAPGAAGECTRHSTDTGAESALSAMLAVAAVATTVAALPRAAAWCADAGLWDQAADDRLRPALVGELLRVVAPSPLLPRVAAADAELDGCPVTAGDRLILVARHAAGAHSRPPDARHPAPPAVAQLVFGAGGHACPGARLARAQLDDTLAALAPYRPVVVRARVDRRAALPAWRSLVIQAADGRTNEPTEYR
ncbi:cytochrome P450 [Yinghuangia seranimata]|uniref:cytochrome P450 n=1 Tax=Yinghuangia seranimata TaxID=408067 RepID=UPI00248AC8FC|nr:cytochrome P450 [Yinghuangia seranimata]MDI2124753.1 cytochrome P450 [Yinghuangia seranimata]